MSVEKLNESERNELLHGHPEWSYDSERDAIARTFRFDDFVGAFGFMTKVAILAEKADHHPEWSNIYNKVDVLLTTHDANGLSARDKAMAEAIDKLV